MVKEIGCFVTGAWTEAGAMTSFLKKVNGNYEYTQLLPNKPKFRRGLDPKVSGLTGDSLIEEMYVRMKRYKSEYAKYAAFIIEDDLDCRFHDKNDVQIHEIKKGIQHEVNNIIGKDIPLIFLLASPEIESWFLTDWSNTFSKLYKNDFFLNRLRIYIDRHIIKDYWEIGIERYGIIEGKYFKLSDQIMDAVQTGVKEELLLKISGNYKKKVQMIFEDRSLYYSKRTHGDQMLRLLSPENLLDKCNLFFAPAYREISSLHLTT
ncbi:hypothetical protein [Paenibacillus sp. sgz302251]|uniref:hypothetical protein n=1 Tax=Paenibacillus sp. sgz302251 TaxID=3414493 RepID=UPI003C7D8BE2